MNYEQVRDKSIEELVNMAAAYYERREYGECKGVLSYLFDSDPHNAAAIAILGAMYVCQDCYGLAEMVYRYGTALYPDLGSMWIGLGTSIRNPERAEESISILEKALEMKPDSTVALTNIASMFSEIGLYKKAIEYAEKALDMKADGKDAYAATDAIALASLGLEDFERGFRLNQESLGVKFRKELIYGEEERWDGEKGKTVVVYGEQGLGDEIFYGSCIPDIVNDCNVIIDCDPRLEGLFKRSFPDAHVYGTRRKAAPWLAHHEWDARCAMADLPYFYRKKKEDFHGTPFLKADPVRSSMWKDRFAGRKKIGISFRGGNKYTNRVGRTIPLECFNPLRKYGDLVSLEYSEYDYKDMPIEVYEWATCSDDYDNTAALISQLDCVVTTCTSVVHLAGALGIPCYVLRNKYYSWRYANDMPWYDSVHVIHCDGDWDTGIEQVIQMINERKAA